MVSLISPKRRYAQRYDCKMQPDVSVEGTAELMTIPVSVIVLTFNEEINIGRCLDSVGWCDDVVVLDSLSTDNTCEIAAEKGARVLDRRFDNYANQRNYALTSIQYKHAWVLMLDADEVVPEEMRQEMQTLLTDADADVTADAAHADAAEAAIQHVPVAERPCRYLFQECTARQRRVAAARSFCLVGNHGHV